MNRRRTAGVTLIEMITVVALVGLVIAISFPAVNSGLDSIRLSSATDSVVAFLNAALTRAERRAELVEITASVQRNEFVMRTVDPAFSRILTLPDGVKLISIHPQPMEGVEEAARSFVLFPGGVIPRFGFELVNRRGVHRIIRVDPISGVPQVEQVRQSE